MGDSRPRAAAAALAATLGVLVVAAVQYATGLLGADGIAGYATYQLVPFAAAASLALAAHRDRAEALGWSMLAAAVAAWGVGDVIWVARFHATPEAAIPFPSLADAGYVAFYPLAFLGLGVLARRRLGRLTTVLWLDGIVAGVTAAALIVALGFDGVTAALGSTDLAATAVNLAYPVGDAILLALVAGALALDRRRPPVRWWLVMGGLALFGLTDVFYLAAVSTDSYVEGGILDLGWICAMAVLALAANARVRPAAVTERDSTVLALLPTGFTVAAVGVLVYDHFERVEPAAVLLTAASLTAAAARSCYAIVENRRLLAASRAEAVTDSLTGMANRRRLVQDLSAVLEHGGRRLLLLFDLNGFKDYNDTFGHPAGDALLARLGHDLELAAAAWSGTAYRLGGDEFCVLVPSGPDRRSVERLCRAALAESGDGFDVSTSCGGVELVTEAGTVADALRIADTRLYEEKARRPSAGAQTTTALMRALQERDRALGLHTDHVAELARRTAELAGMSAPDIETVRIAAQLHDIGKIAIPDRILEKTGPLTDDEWDFMRTHTLIGERILHSAPALAHVSELVRSAHERWDGAGYPDGLAGDAIPLGARIVFACDAYDAMVGERTYRGRLSHEQAVAELRRHAGSQFDADVVELVVAAAGERDAGRAAA